MTVDIKELVALHDASEGNDNSKFVAAIGKVKEGLGENNPLLNDPALSRQGEGIQASTIGSGSLLESFFKKVFGVGVDDERYVDGDDTYEDFQTTCNRTIEVPREIDNIDESPAVASTSTDTSTASLSNDEKYRGSFITAFETNLGSEGNFLNSASNIKFEENGNKIKVVLSREDYSEYTKLDPDVQVMIKGAFASSMTPQPEAAASAEQVVNTGETPAAPAPASTRQGAASTAGTPAAASSTSTEATGQGGAALPDSTGTPAGTAAASPSPAVLTPTPVATGQGGTPEQITPEVQTAPVLPPKTTKERIFEAQDIKALEDISASPLFSRRGTTVGDKWTQDHGQGDISLGSALTQERGQINRFTAERDGNIDHANKDVARTNDGIERYLNDHRSNADNLKGGNLTALFRGVRKETFTAEEQEGADLLRKGLEKKDDDGIFTPISVTGDDGQPNAVGKLLEGHQTLKDLVNNRKSTVEKSHTNKDALDGKIDTQLDYAKSKVVERETLKDYNGLESKQALDTAGQSVVQDLVAQERLDRTNTLKGFVGKAYDTAKGSDSMGSFSAEVDSLKPGNKWKHKGDKQDVPTANTVELTPEGAIKAADGVFDKLMGDNDKFVAFSNEFRDKSGLGGKGFETFREKNTEMFDDADKAYFDKCPKIMNGLLKEKFSNVAGVVSKEDRSVDIQNEKGESVESANLKGNIYGHLNDMSEQYGKVIDDSKFTDYQKAKKSRYEQKENANSKENTTVGLGIGRRVSHGLEDAAKDGLSAIGKVAEAGATVVAGSLAVPVIGLDRTIGPGLTVPENPGIKVEAYKQGNAADPSTASNTPGSSENGDGQDPGPEENLSGPGAGLPAGGSHSPLRRDHEASPLEENMIQDLANSSGVAGSHYGEEQGMNMSSIAGVDNILNSLGSYIHASGDTAFVTTALTDERASTATVAGGGNVEIGSANGTESISMPAEAARDAKDIVGDLAGGSTAAQGEAAVSTTASAEVRVGGKEKIKSGGR